MPRIAAKTRKTIVDAAVGLFYAEGIRRVSVDAIAEKAGVTKRTLYYHFRSKDDLIATYLESRDLPNLQTFQRWFEETEGPVPARVEAIFSHLARASRHPKWKGCGFLRTAAELANMPGHPAVKAGSAHKKRVEAWLADEIAAAGVKYADDTARQIVLLMDGAFSLMLVHRDPAYFEAAGRAAVSLLERDR